MVVLCDKIVYCRRTSCTLYYQFAPVPYCWVPLSSLRTPTTARSPDCDPPQPLYCEFLLLSLPFFSPRPAYWRFLPFTAPRPTVPPLHQCRWGADLPVVLAARTLMRPSVRGFRYSVIPPPTLPTPVAWAFSIYGTPVIPHAPIYVVRRIFIFAP